MASSIQLNSTNNSEMTIEYQGTSGVPKTVVVPDRDMTVGSEITLGTAVTASGTSVDFTGIPSGVKRVTVMFDGVSTSGAGSPMQIQLGGSGGIETTGYLSASCNIAGSPASLSSTTGLLCNQSSNPVYVSVGKADISLMGTNQFVFTSALSQNIYPSVGGGSKTLSGTLDRVRITTVNGTDTFDAGTINISWEF